MTEKAGNNRLQPIFIRATLDLYCLGWSYQDIARVLEDGYEDAPEFYDAEIREVITTNGNPSWLKWWQMENAIPGEVVAEAESKEMSANREIEISQEETSNTSFEGSEGKGKARIENLSVPILQRLSPDESDG